VILVLDGSDDSLEWMCEWLVEGAMEYRLLRWVLQMDYNRNC
jgi:hypothetical protein